MENSIVNSVAGHLQIYSADAEDELSLFLPFMGSKPDVGAIPNFETVQTALSAIDNIENIIPQGIDNCLTMTQNIMDIKVEELRQASKEGDQEEIENLIANIKQILEVLEEDLQKLYEIGSRELAQTQQEGDAFADVKYALSEEFWQLYERDYEEACEFLANSIAPILLEDDFVFLSYIGTDIEKFTNAFELFKLVRGEMIPPGQRGFLFNETSYEKQTKHPIARRMDEIKEELDDGMTIAESETLQQMIKRNRNEYKEIVFQLSINDTKEVRQRLQEYLNTAEEDIILLIQDFLNVNDENFYERYDLFYEIFTDKIIMYKLKIGDYLYLKTFVRGGGVRTVKVKLYGVFIFEGLEKSAIAGLHSLIDIISFRDLYGFSTPEQRQEFESIAQESGIQRMSQEDIMSMFEDPSDIEQEAEMVNFEAQELIDQEYIAQRREELEADRVYSKEEINQGICLNAAIFLKDPTLITQTVEEINRINEEQGLNIQVTDWKTASGTIGYFITLLKVILVFALLIIFSVALVIIVNSMVMATLERTHEIGTMRAIGARKNYIMKLFITETVIQSLIFGILGIICGSTIIGLLNHFGIPAFNDISYFMFGGDYLHPYITWSNITMAFFVILLVSVISTIYPAFLASKVSPIVAMQKEG